MSGAIRFVLGARKRARFFACCERLRMRFKGVAPYATDTPRAGPATLTSVPRQRDLIPEPVAQRDDAPIVTRAPRIQDAIHDAARHRHTDVEQGVESAANSHAGISGSARATSAPSVTACTTSRGFGDATQRSSSKSSMPAAAIHSGQRVDVTPSTSSQSIRPSMLRSGSPMSNAHRAPAVGSPRHRVARSQNDAARSAADGRRRRDERVDARHRVAPVPQRNATRLDAQPLVALPHRAYEREPLAAP
ncbi:hypothetical protein [Burkholderia dolosa]|uniref:hypothetical protein n=1 Tax=Burkholderia dolosa TaxID=152500 RepID=UPI001B95D14C|nr:hypothetical protein [Burkholderia dolosa]MBR8056630.1 hypothetical protein [Burkholderia dolosa]